MKKEPKVSIIISTYNRYEYLNEAIDSILNQTYKNIELIIIIEYSKLQNEIETIINKYSDSRIRIIKNKEKKGLPLSLNEGIRISTGTYIARMDDDDISVLTRIEKQVKYLESNPNISIVGSHINCFGKKNYIDKQPLHHNDIKAKILFETPLFHPTVMFRKNDFIKNNLFYSNDYITEDFDLWTKAICILKFANIDETLLYYRISDSNITTNNHKKIFEDHKRILQKFYKKVFNLDFSLKEVELLRRAFNGWIIYPNDYLLFLKAKKKLILCNRKVNYCEENAIKTNLNYLKHFSKKVIIKIKTLIMSK